MGTPLIYDGRRSGMIGRGLSLTINSMESVEKGSSDNIQTIDNSLGKIIRINHPLFHG